MKTFVIPASQLTAEHVFAWNAIQQADDSLASPFFRPEFLTAVAEVPSDIEVAVLEHDGEFVGFFPFQRRNGNVGRFVGGEISDYQGLVMKPDIQLDVPELLHHCHLSAWDFDHVPTKQLAFRKHHWHETRSPFIDTSGGFEKYVTNRREAGSKVISRVLQKRRKLEREIGPVRVVAASRDPLALEMLAHWKSAQFRSAGMLDMFSHGWTKRLFQNLLLRSDRGLFATMSVLYVNDEMAAVFYFLRSHRMAHAWSTAYNPDLAKYSPGCQLLLATIQSANDLDIDTIDLGKGEERYKQSFMSGSNRVTEGSVDFRVLHAAARKWWHQARRWVRASPFGPPAIVPWRGTAHSRTVATLIALYVIISSGKPPGGDS